MGSHVSALPGAVLLPLSPSGGLQSLFQQMLAGALSLGGQNKVLEGCIWHSWSFLYHIEQFLVKQELHQIRDNSHA